MLFQGPTEVRAINSCRDTYPAQLDAVRKRGGILFVMIDGDNYSIEG